MPEQRNKRRLQQTKLVFHHCTTKAAAKKAATHEFLISPHKSSTTSVSGKRSTSITKAKQKAKTSTEQ